MHLSHHASCKFSLKLARCEHVSFGWGTFQSLPELLRDPTKAITMGEFLRHRRNKTHTNPSRIFQWGSLWNTCCIKEPWAVDPWFLGQWPMASPPVTTHPFRCQDAWLCRNLRLVKPAMTSPRNTSRLRKPVNKREGSKVVTWSFTKGCTVTPIFQPTSLPLFLLCHSRPKESTLAEVCTSICQGASQRRSVLTGPLAADPALLSNQATGQTSLLKAANLEATTLGTHKFGSRRVQLWFKQVWVLAH